MTRRAPRVATLLLERLGPDNDALLGDLAEEYRAGRSAFWYWRQALTAIVIGTSRDLWAHKSLAVHTIATGIGLMFLVGTAWTRLWFQSGVSMEIQNLTVWMWGRTDSWLVPQLS